MAPRLKSLFHKVFIKRRQVGGNKCWVSTACFASCVRGHRVRQVVVWGLVRQVADRWFVAWSDRWLASRTDRWLMGGLFRQVADKWLVAWSLTLIVREVSDRVYGLKDRQFFALYDRWLVLCCLLVRQVVGCLCMVYGLWGIQVFVLY